MIKFREFGSEHSLLDLYRQCGSIAVFARFLRIKALRARASPYVIWSSTGKLPLQPWRWRAPFGDLKSVLGSLTRNTLVLGVPGFGSRRVSL